MKRRTFIKSAMASLVSVSGLNLLAPAGRRAWGEDTLADASELRIWSYYVPLTSYSGILENPSGGNPLDRKLIFEEVIKKTDRINGKESDGTKNPESFQISELQNASEYLRVHFWHDDNGIRRPSGHSLYVFKRYLEDLENGKKVFVGTGMYQNHFHVVMIQPPTED